VTLGGGKGVSKRERTMLLALAGVAAAAGAYFLMTTVLGGEEESVDIPQPTPVPTVTASPPAKKPRATSDIFEGRDPFEPLVDQTGGDGNGSGVVPGNGGGTSKLVLLVDIFEQDGVLMAVVDVGGEQFTVVEGDTFDDNFQLLDLTRRCGSFSFGDEAFTLCIGQEVRK